MPSHHRITPPPKSECYSWSFVCSSRRHSRTASRASRRVHAFERRNILRRPGAPRPAGSCGVLQTGQLGSVLVCSSHFAMQLAWNLWPHRKLSSRPLHSRQIGHTSPPPSTCPNEAEAIVSACSCHLIFLQRLRKMQKLVCTYGPRRATRS